MVEGSVARRSESACDLGCNNGCPEIGNAGDVEGEGRWSEPDSATCFRSSFVSASREFEVSSSMSSPENEKLKADILLDVEFGRKDPEDARELNVEGETKGAI